MAIALEPELKSLLIFRSQQNNTELLIINLAAVLAERISNTSSSPSLSR